MKTCGIDIDKDTVRFILLEEQDNEISIITVKNSLFKLKDTTTSKGLKDFKDVIYSFLDSHSLDKIAIISRLATGRLSAHGTSFKIEAVFQLYTQKSIEVISSKTISTFLKKKPHNFTTEQKNQKECLDLAFYLLFN